MHLNDFQDLIKKIYLKKDSGRGIHATFNWLVEEIGELSRAIRHADKAHIKEEFADCLAWLLSVGTILGVDAEDAMRKYTDGCPKCHKSPCECSEENK
jgi:NTP pyrophosphatase (non-canonical NTP hydrolase)